MKPLYTVITVLLFSLSANANAFKSLFSKTSTFAIVEYSADGYTWIDSISISTDTMIKGQAYRNVNSISSNSIAAIREDTVAGKIWMKPYESTKNPKDTTEVLIFDYNLNVGDTFNISEYSSNIAIPVGQNEVDSVYYVNGSKHIRFKYFIPNKNEHYEFIEGIGGNTSYFYKFQGGDFLSKFICYVLIKMVRSCMPINIIMAIAPPH